MLKKLLLRKKIDEKKSQLATIMAKKEEVNKRELELVADVEARTELTDEEKEIIEAEATDIETQKKNLEEEIETLQKELEEAEAELEELNAKDENAIETTNNENEETNERTKQKNTQIRGGVATMKMELREKVNNLIVNESNKKFFDQIRSLMLRADSTELTGKELLVPEDVMAVINQEVYGYGTVVKLVDTITLKGNARIIVNGGTPKLFWTEKCASLQEATLGSFKEIELDNYKLGGYVFLCKAFVEDAIIDVAEYVIKEFAMAIAIALDEAIIKGQGAEQKQPEGITKVVTEKSTVKDLLAVLGLVGTLNPKSKNVTLLVNRQTYYKNILPETFGKDDKGRIVYGLGQTLPDGTKVEISEAVDNNEFIVGDFKQGYKLGVRKEMSFDTSDQVRWIEEQIGYKTSGRYDGKVVDKSFFVRGEFTPVV